MNNMAEDVAFKEFEFGYAVPWNDGVLEGPDIDRDNQPGIQKVSDNDGCRQLTTATKLMFKTSYRIFYTSYKDGLYIIHILTPMDWTLKDRSMQYGFVIADVLQSCSWERCRLRVSINPIVIQLYSENKNKLFVSDILFPFVKKVHILHFCIDYRIINLKAIVSKIADCFTILFSFIFPIEW